MDTFLKEGCKAPWALRKLMQSKKYGVGDLRHLLELNGFEGRSQVSEVTEVTQTISLAPKAPDTKPVDPSKEERQLRSYPVKTQYAGDYYCYWEEKPDATPPYALIMENPQGQIFDMKRWLKGDLMYLELYFETNAKAGRVMRTFKKLPPGTKVKDA